MTSRALAHRHDLAKLSGIAGLLGAGLFMGAVVLLHVARSDVDWRHDYVSHFVHGRLGWLFVVATVLHGFGNLALGLGLGGSLVRDRLLTRAVLLFGAAAAATIVAGLLPIDRVGTGPTLIGRMHRSMVAVSFLGELFAAFLFSAAFARNPGWEHRSGPSFVLSAIATLALAGFLAALLLRRMHGVAERSVLATCMAWEFRVAMCLIRSAFGTREMTAD